ncbi:hypothetical protein JOM56_015022 [Amanita muscaria]
MSFYNTWAKTRCTREITTAQASREALRIVQDVLNLSNGLTTVDIFKYSALLPVNTLRLSSSCISLGLEKLDGYQIQTILELFAWIPVDDSTQSLSRNPIPEPPKERAGSAKRARIEKVAKDYEKMKEVLRRRRERCYKMVVSSSGVILERGRPVTCRTSLSLSATLDEGPGLLDVRKIRQIWRLWVYKFSIDHDGATGLTMSVVLNNGITRSLRIHLSTWPSSLKCEAPRIRFLVEDGRLKKKVIINGNE